jgi:hypothetical protein
MYLFMLDPALFLRHVLSVICRGCGSCAKDVSANVPRRHAHGQNCGLTVRPASSEDEVERFRLACDAAEGRL